MSTATRKRNPPTRVRMTLDAAKVLEHEVLFDARAVAEEEGDEETLERVSEAWDLLRYRNSDVVLEFRRDLHHKRQAARWLAEEIEKHSWLARPQVRGPMERIARELREAAG